MTKEGKMMPNASEKDTINLRDPWINRSEKMLCQSCMYFVIKKDSIGRCRRHAPTMKGFPAVFKTDWCGDHKINENEI